MVRIVAILCALLTVRPAHASDDERQGLCVALDARCDRQLLLRAGFGLTVNHDEEFGRYHLLPTIGLMFDRGHQDWAFGAAAIAIIGEQTRWGIEAPVRYWLNTRTAVELAPGVLTNPAPGVTPSLRAGIYTHWVGLGVRYSIPNIETYDQSGYRLERRHELTLEAALTGLPGGIALAACAVAVATLVTVFVATYDN